MVKKYDTSLISRAKKSIRNMDRDNLEFFINTYSKKKGGDPMLPYMKKIYKSKYK